MWVNASQCRVLEAREREWSSILRAKARAECKHSFRGAVLKRTSMKRAQFNITHSVRSTPLTTISTATLWLNH